MDNDIEELKSINSEFDKMEQGLLELALRGGEILVRKRVLFPRSGPNAKGWSELLGVVGMNRQRAWEWIGLWEGRDEIRPESGQNLGITEALVKLGLWKRKEVPEEPVQPKLSFGEKVDKTFRDELERNRSYIPPSKPENEIAFPVWRTHFGNCLQEIERNFNYEQQKEIAESMIVTILAKYPDLGETKFRVI